MSQARRFAFTCGELAAAVKLADAHTIHALIERFMRWNLPAVGAAIVSGGVPVDTVTITTPYAGLVFLPSEGEGTAAAKLPAVGQEVMADTPLLRLVEPRSFMIVVHVPEARAHWLRVGQRGVATSAGIQLPKNFDQLIEQAEKDLGPIPQPEEDWDEPETGAGS